MITSSFQPHALKSVFGEDADKFTQNGFDLNLVQDKKYLYLTDQIVNEQNIENKINMLSDFLLRRLRINDLIRTFKEFTGLSPLEFKRQSGGIIDNIS